MNKIQFQILLNLLNFKGSCYVVATWEAFVIGVISALLCYLTILLIEKTSLDDPCCAFAIHCVGGSWGMLAVGIFAKSDPRLDVLKYDGVLHGRFSSLMLIRLSLYVSLQEVSICSGFKRWPH